VKPPLILGNADFWRGLVIAVLALVVVFLWNEQRGVSHSQETLIVGQTQTIAAQKGALVNLCNTQRVLGLGFTQLHDLDAQFLLDPALAKTTKATVSKRLHIYNIMLAEFQKTKPCEQIE